MTDPSRRDEWAQEHPGTYSYPAIPGDSHGPRARQDPTRHAPAGPDPTQQLPAYSPYGYDPYGTSQYGSSQFGSAGGPGEPPPEPPRGRDSRFWLWAATGGALLLVAGMVIGLVIVNSSQQQTVVAPPQTPIEPTLTRAPSTTAPTTTRTPSRTRTPIPIPNPSQQPDEANPGTPHTVVYSVAGEGRAISILYLDSGGVLQTEFNVLLPWSKEVQLTGQADRSASVSIVNVGRELTCSITIDGVDTQQNSGTGLTLCTAFGTR